MKKIFVILNIQFFLTGCSHFLIKNIDFKHDKKAVNIPENPGILTPYRSCFDINNKSISGSCQVKVTV